MRWVKYIIGVLNIPNFISAPPPRRGPPYQHGINLEIGIPQWVKDMVGKDWSNLTRKVTVTFHAKDIARVEVECFGLEIDDKPFYTAKYLRVNSHNQVEGL